MKQSVYLSKEEHARWKALRVSLGDVVRAGLSVLESRQADRKEQDNAGR